MFVTHNLRIFHGDVVYRETVMRRAMRSLLLAKSNYLTLMPEIYHERHIQLELNQNLLRCPQTGLAKAKCYNITNALVTRKLYYSSLYAASLTQFNFLDNICASRIIIILSFTKHNIKFNPS